MAGVCTQPSILDQDPGVACNHHPHSSGTLKLVLPSEMHINPYEDADQISQSTHTQIGMFGDFCLLCGEMIVGEGLDGGSAYCSEECEYHQHMMSDSDWCDLSMEGYQLPSYGGSTADSSAKTSPSNSPHLQPSDRLAILCSGPPPCESLLPLDLDKRLLGADAVAKRYLDHGTRYFEQEGDSEDEKKDETAQITYEPTDPSDRIGSRNLSVQANSKLKSQPALAQLTDFDHLIGLSQLLARKEDPTTRPNRHYQSISMIDLSSPSLTEVDHRHPTSSTSKSSRRVSEPVLSQAKSFSLSLTPHHPFYSSFSFNSLVARSHASFNWSNDLSTKKKC